jgi:integrase
MAEKKKKTRGHGEGTITQRPNGTWMGQVTLYIDENGKAKRATYYGKTRPEVVEKVNKAKAQIDTGTFAPPTRLTFGDWLDTWLHEYKATSTRPTTFAGYEMLVRVHIKPSIGYLPLQDLRADQLQKFYNDKFKNGRVQKESDKPEKKSRKKKKSDTEDGTNKGLSAATIKKMHLVIHEALQQAMKNNLVSRNVSEATTLPKGKKKEIRVLTAEDEQKFLGIIKEDRMRTAFILELNTGFRLGEVLGLKWKDIDLEKGNINICRSIVRVPIFKDGKKKGTKLVEQDPKTNAGRRSVPLHAGILQELKHHKARQAAELLSKGIQQKEETFVFCTIKGTPIEPRNLLRSFYRTIEKAGIDKSNFHALRHTMATKLLGENVHAKIAQEILGHSSITLTLDTYSHVSSEMKQNAMDKLYKAE